MRTSATSTGTSSPPPARPGEPYCLVKGNQLVISANCKYPQYAFEFLKFMVSPEIELMLHGDTLRRGVPTRLSVLHPAPGTPKERNYLYATRPFFHADVFPYALDHGRELPIDATWPVWTTEAQKHLDRLFIDPDADTGQVLHDATAAVNLVLQRENKRLERYLRPTEASHAH